MRKKYIFVGEDSSHKNEIDLYNKNVLKIDKLMYTSLLSFDGFICDPMPFYDNGLPVLNTILYEISDVYMKKLFLSDVDIYERFNNNTYRSIPLFSDEIRNLNLPPNFIKSIEDNREKMEPLLFYILMHTHPIMVCDIDDTKHLLYKLI